MAPPLPRRLACLLYEWLVVDALVLLVVAIFSLVTAAAPALAHQRPVLLSLCFLTLAGYFLYCWRNGQTLAMRAWRMKIEDAGGGPVSLGRACVRYVLAWVWVVPPLAVVSLVKPYAQSVSSALAMSAAATLAWVLLWSLASYARTDRQYWHDVAAGTRIVPA